jgi:hypothetical protein
VPIFFEMKVSRNMHLSARVAAACNWCIAIASVAIVIYIWPLMFSSPQLSAASAPTIDSAGDGRKAPAGAISNDKDLTRSLAPVQTIKEVNTFKPPSPAANPQAVPVQVSPSTFPPSNTLFPKANRTANTTKGTGEITTREPSTNSPVIYPAPPGLE